MNKQTQKSTVSELLPWYINGTLSDSEKQAVEAELAISDSLKQEEQWLRQVMQDKAMPALELSDAEVDQQYARVMQQIAQQPAEDAQASAPNAANDTHVVSATSKPQSSDDRQHSGEQTGSNLWHDVMQGLSDIMTSIKSVSQKPQAWVPMGAALTLSAAALLIYQAPQHNAQNNGDFSVLSSTGSERVDPLHFSLTTTRPLALDVVEALVLSKVGQEIPGDMEIIVSQVSEQVFELVIPASLDFSTSAQLLSALESTTEIESTSLEVDTAGDN